MIPDEIRRQLGAALDAVEFLGDGRFTWLGEEGATIPAEVRRRMQPETERSYLVLMLASQLYNDFYVHGWPVPLSRRRPERLVGDPEFVATLFEARGDVGQWQDGWRLVAAEGRELLVERDGLEVAVRRRQVRRVDEGGRLVQLRWPTRWPALSPGFFTVLSKLERERSEEQRLVRLYWHLRPSAAPRFVRTLGGALDRCRVAFDFKLANAPTEYGRADAGVLYMGAKDLVETTGALRRLYRGLRDELDEQTPALTRRLAPGLALAQDPIGSESFGMHRCRLIAEGLVWARDHGDEGRDGRWRCVAEVFDEAGTSVERPHVHEEDGDPLAPGVAF